MKLGHHSMMGEGGSTQHRKTQNKQRKRFSLQKHFKESFYFDRSKE